MLYLAISLRPHGILALRSLPQSKTRLAFKYAPPSSLLGALVYAILRLKGIRIETEFRAKSALSIVESYKDLFISVSMSVNIEPIVHGLLLRINRYYRGDIDSSLTSFPVAIYYSDPDPLIRIVYLINEKRLDFYGLTKSDLLRAGWGIVRLGSRESLVSVDDVVLRDTEIISEELSEDNAIMTEFSFELREKIFVRGNYSLQYVVNWRDTLSDYSLAEKIPVVYPRGAVSVWGDLKYMQTVYGSVVI